MYGDALQEIADALVAAGIPATTEASQLQTPGVLVTPGPLSFNRQSADVLEAVIELYLITGNKPAPQALNDLSTLLMQVRDLYAVGEAEPLTMTLQATGRDPVPCLRTELTVQITKD
ncbi:hypothetical protein DQF30_23575 [Shigella flexneri]|nr:hypothetical protein [Shigella flexneri]